MSDNDLDNLALESRVGEIESQVVSLGEQVDNPDDLSTYNGGHVVENQPEESMKPQLSFDKFTYASDGKINGVVFTSRSGGVDCITNFCTLATDGTFTLTTNAGSVTYGTITLDPDSINYIHLKLKSTLAWTIDGTLESSTYDPGADDTPAGYFYIPVAQIELTAGKVVDSNTYWYYAGGSLNFYSWDLGDIITSSTLSGDLTSGYTLTNTTRHLIIGPCFAGGASS